MENELNHDILDKLYRYLSYQERCRNDIEKKLAKLAVASNEHEHYISYLEKQNYLSEERYTNNYVTSKIRGNKWGKRKVRYSLKRKNISERLIDQSLRTFPDEEYEEIASQLAVKKNGSVNTDDFYKRKQKIYRYLAQKGFEHSIIQSSLDKLFLT